MTATKSTGGHNLRIWREPPEDRAAKLRDGNAGTKVRDEVKLGPKGDSINPQYVLYTLNGGKDLDTDKVEQDMLA